MKLFGKFDTKLFVLLAVAALLLAACGGGGAEPTPVPDGPGGVSEETPESGGSGGGSESTGLCSNPYHPVVEGASWTYDVSGPDGPSSYTSSISAVRADGFTLTHTFENLVVTQEWTCTEEGLAALEYGGGPEASVTTAGMSSNFDTISSSGVVVPRNMAVGDTWEQVYAIEGTIDMDGLVATAAGNITHSFTAMGLEPVTAAAGSFTGMRVYGTTVLDLQVTLDGGFTVPFMLESSSIGWWVEGIGMVRSDGTVTFEGGDAFESNTQLTTYNIP